MSNTTSTEKPFKVVVPDADIELLQQKLELVRFPDELDGAAWDYGSPLADVKRLTERWKSGFDWRKAEAQMNELPMFTRDIDVEGFGTLNIHYVHQVSDVKNAIPLLFVHGCEFQLGRGLQFTVLINLTRRAWTFSRSEKAPPALDEGRE